MRKFIVTVNGVSYDVEVEEKDAASVQPAVKEQTRTAVQPAENKPAAVKPAAVSGAGNPVKAPLPGTVLEVRASRGQAVKAGDVLMILEAMKMENEILAPADGTVSEIVASKGAEVGTGDILLYLA